MFFSIAVPCSMMDKESAQFWRHCATGEHVLFCSCESFTTQLRLRLSTKSDCRDVALSTSESVNLYRTMLCSARTTLPQRVCLCLLHSGIVSKPLNVLSKLFHRLMDQSF